MAPVSQGGGVAQNGRVISLELAVALRTAGVRWHPRPGDSFVVPDREMDEQVFVLSDMVIQTVEVPDGPPILAFNGTTEWALDSLEAAEAVWLPREDQLRALLGQAFVSTSAPRRRTPGRCWQLNWLISRKTSS